MTPAKIKTIGTAVAGALFGASMAPGLPAPWPMVLVAACFGLCGALHIPRPGDSKPEKSRPSVPPTSIVWLVLLVALATPGCAAVIALLPKVIAAVEIAEQAIDAVQSFADAKADAALREKIDAAATRARQALTAAIHAAKGSGELAEKDVRAAFDDFQAAYQALVDICAPLGVRAQDAPKLSAERGTLTVPTPAALRAEMERE